MASVSLIYNAVRDLANKDARGFITPQMFNRFAKAAQISIFNKILSDLSISAKATKTGADPGRNLSLSKGLMQDIARFEKKVTDHTVSNGIAALPADMLRIISITTKGQLSLGRRRDKQVEIIYNADKLDRILRSTLSAPSNDFPVALVSNDIEVFPENIKKINIRYYREPVDPSISITDQGGLEVVSDSTDFELPENYTMDLIVEIAKMVGVNLKEPEIRNFIQIPSTNVVSPKK